MARRPNRAERRGRKRLLADLARAGRAATDQQLSLIDALVLGALHQFAFSKRVCWPSQETIADLIGSRREYVNRACFSLAGRGLISWTKAWSPRSRHLHNVYELHGRWHPAHRRPLLRWLDRRRGDHTKRPATVEGVGTKVSKDNKAGGSTGLKHQRCGRERVRERRSGDAGPTEDQTQGAGAETVLVARIGLGVGAEFVLFVFFDAAERAVGATALDGRRRPPRRATSSSCSR